jgi:hypothetical protein
LKKTKGILSRIFIFNIFLIAIGCSSGTKIKPNPDLTYKSYKPHDSDKVISRENYYNKLQGFWLGQCIANWTGLVTEMDKIGNIGDVKTGWYYANWLWKLRGFIDKVFRGVGLRRGRTNINDIRAGDTLDFWRVLYASKAEKPLLLFAEMKLPGEAWLEFQVKDNHLIQTATFRPKGLFGRIYWYSVLPLHGIIFRGMINKLA